LIASYKKAFVLTFLDLTLFYKALLRFKQTHCSPKLLGTISRKLKGVGWGEGKGAGFFPSPIAYLDILKHFLWNLEQQGSGKNVFAVYFYTCYDLNFQTVRDIF
jgi:hypothetical protein